MARAHNAALTAAARGLLRRDISAYTGAAQASSPQRMLA